MSESPQPNDDKIVPFAAAAAAAAPPPGPTAPPVGAAAGAGDITDAFETKKGVEEYFFNEEGRHFLRKNAAGAWISLSESAFVRHLKKEHGKNDKPGAGKIVSPAHEIVHDVENNRRVAYAGVIAGYRSGMHHIAGRRILVTEDPVRIEPADGKWPLLEEFFKNLFSGEEPAGDGKTTIAVDQRPWVYGWLQHVVQCYYSGRTSPGLAFCLAGDPNCGKTMFALVLRWILGGRVAKPYRFMMNEDSFNRDLIEAVLQLVDDENQADTDYKARQKFAGELKMIVANNEFRVRAMHTDPFAIPLLRRLVVLCNLQGTRLLVLPPLDGDVDDKMHLFKGYVKPPPAAPISSDTPAEQACWPMPMPTRTEEERERFRAAIQAELPAFLWWLLNEYKMPSQVSGGRFVVRHYHHPALVAALHEHSPHVRLWDLIVRSGVVFLAKRGTKADGYIWFARKEPWRGGAGALEQLLKKNEDSLLSKEERSEIKASNWLGRTLDLCRQHFGPAICRQEIGHEGRVWVLAPRPEDKVEVRE